MSRQPIPEIPTVAKEVNALEPSLVTEDNAINVHGRSHAFGANADLKMSEEEAETGAADSPEPLHEEPVVSRRELWSYYLYYNGDNGVGPLSSTATIFQGLANAAGQDPTTGSSCTSTGPCVLPWGSGTKAVSSVVLVASGLSFAIMTLIFTTIGSAADYGNFGKYLLLAVTVICWAAQFATISLTKPDRWGVAFALYVIGYVSYGATLVFYAALFPRLARNTARSRALKKQYEEGKISTETYELEESLEKNRISNISTAHSNIGYLVTLCLNLSILLPLKSNPLVDNYVLLLVNSYWVILGIWWFIFQAPRPGPPLPKGEHYLTIGWKQIWEALKQCHKLPNTFIYLFGFFLLADGFNTSGTLVLICQNDKFNFSFLQNTYLGLAQALTSTLSTLGFWYIQRYWKINTKTMLTVTNIITVIIPLWGMIGLWTDKIGFHNVWEFWLYNVASGLFQAPYYAFSQTMMAELSPVGYENMMFGLFGLSNRASSMIGPNVIQAIINRTGNNWDGFPFLFAMCTAASLIIWFGVDVKKGRRDAALWAAERRASRKIGRLD